MTERTSPRRNPFARGDRFGAVDAVMLFIPFLAIVMLFLPAALETFYWGPMARQQGIFTVEHCEDLSSKGSTFRCVGGFVPDDGSAPITRAPHTFDSDDSDEFLYSGDRFPAILYANDAIRPLGAIPYYYYAFYGIGGILLLIGGFIVAVYLRRWAKRRREDRAAASDAPAFSFEQIARPAPRVSITGAQVRADGWDVESPVVSDTRYRAVSVALIIAGAIAVGSFAVAGVTAVYQGTTPRTEGVVLIDGCVQQPYFDGERRRPVIACEGQFLPYSADDPLGAAGPVAFDARGHKAFEPGEEIPATLYPDGTLIEEAPFDLPGNTPLLVGVVFGGVTLLLVLVWWLNRLARRPSELAG